MKLLFNEKPISKEFKDKLEQFSKIFGVLKYVILEYDDENIENIYNLCQAAAIEGLRALYRRDKDYYNKHGFSKEEMDRHLSCYEILNEYPRGEILTIEEFFGPHFDFENKKIIIRGRNRDHLNDYFYFDAEENAENVVFPVYGISKIPNPERLEKIYKYSCIGYSKCFIEPPYGLDAEKEVINQLFLDFNKLFFYDFEFPIWIYIWDENCSKFFEFGKEWWGAYLWTVLIEEKKEIVVIAASSSD